jgi:hypothetical protein
MSADREQESIGKALRAIGKSKLPLNKALIRDFREVLVEKGYDSAVVYAQQTYLAADENAELVRILIICRRYGLNPEEAAQVIDELCNEQFGQTSI